MVARQVDEARWKNESEFFDRKAAAEMARIRPMHPMTRKRYAELRRRRFSKEFRFRLLGSVAGKSVLDVGCGDGLNAMNFAVQGARVTGIDISPKAIELAGRRAEVNGVSRLTNFVCSPLETAQFKPGAFDIIWGDAILHHLISDLDSVLTQLVRWARPGGCLIFGEPVNLNPVLRRLRRALPITTDATPDERPLEQAELQIIAHYVPDMHIRFFSVFDRLNRFVLENHNYELSSPVRRTISNMLSMVDFALLSVPVFESLAGTCVIYGHAPAVLE